MTTEEIITAHEYIMQHDLLHVVESTTKKNWRGVGSRATYYEGLRKVREIGTSALSLVEYLMLSEAVALVLRHTKETATPAPAA